MFHRVPGQPGLVRETHLGDGEDRGGTKQKSKGNKKEKERGTFSKVTVLRLRKDHIRTCSVSSCLFRVSFMEASGVCVLLLLHFYFSVHCTVFSSPSRNVAEGQEHKAPRAVSLGSPLLFLLPRLFSFPAGSSVGTQRKVTHFTCGSPFCVTSPSNSWKNSHVN